MITRTDNKPIKCYKLVSSQCALKALWTLRQEMFITKKQLNKYETCPGKTGGWCTKFFNWMHYNTRLQPFLFHKFPPLFNFHISDRGERNPNFDQDQVDRCRKILHNLGDSVTVYMRCAGYSNAKAAYHAIIYFRGSIYDSSFGEARNVDEDGWLTTMYPSGRVNHKITRILQAYLVLTRC